MASTLQTLYPILLARLGPHTTREVWASILETEYSYFDSLTKVAQEGESSNLAFYTRQASSILDFGVSNMMKSLYLINFDMINKHSSIMSMLLLLTVIGTLKSLKGLLSSSWRCKLLLIPLCLVVCWLTR